MIIQMTLDGAKLHKKASILVPGTVGHLCYGNITISIISQLTDTGASLLTLTYLIEISYSKSSPKNHETKSTKASFKSILVPEI